MNNRIKQLAEQATNPNWDGDDGPANEFNPDKFAELIVRECASIDFYNLAGFDLHDHDRASQVIKEHFGVE